MLSYKYKVAAVPSWQVDGYYHVVVDYVKLNGELCDNYDSYYTNLTKQQVIDSGAESVYEYYWDKHTLGKYEREKLHSIKIKKITYDVIQWSTKENQFVWSLVGHEKKYADDYVKNRIEEGIYSFIVESSAIDFHNGSRDKILEEYNSNPNIVSSAKELIKKNKNKDRIQDVIYEFYKEEGYKLESFKYVVCEEDQTIVFRWEDEGILTSKIKEIK